MSSQTRTISVQAYYAVPFHAPSSHIILRSQEPSSAPPASKAESVKAGVSPSIKRRPSLASLRTFSSKTSATIAKVENGIPSVSGPLPSPVLRTSQPEDNKSDEGHSDSSASTDAEVHPKKKKWVFALTKVESESTTPPNSPPPEACSTTQSTDNKSDEDHSDASTGAEGEAQRKKKKWVLFAKNLKKEKSADGGENGYEFVSIPSIPANGDYPPPNSESASLTASQPRAPKLSSRFKSPNVLKKPPPLDTEALKRPDTHSQQPDLTPAEMSKIDASFSLDSAPLSGNKVALGPKTPRTPGGTAIPSHLFAPGHLVDREFFLEQIRRKGAGLDGDGATWKKRPLSFVPELAESDDGKDEVSWLRNVSSAVAVEIDDERLAFDGVARDLDSEMGELVPHCPEEAYVFCTVDAEWNSHSGEGATFYLHEVFDVARNTDPSMVKPIDEMSDEELDAYDELIRNMGLAM
ncbi:hypothetical protein VNI00_007788 [Paramarasmius palmivorus]|uniref:Uncharacterized protein n=1 Tax=Paramarasmius palmivorus TaxID=297713 RepID=A0AAW0CYF1_9AGAR